MRCKCNVDGFHEICQCFGLLAGWAKVEMQFDLLLGLLGCSGRKQYIWPMLVRRRGRFPMLILKPHPNLGIKIPNSNLSEHINIT